MNLTVVVLTALLVAGAMPLGSGSENATTNSKSSDASSSPTSDAEMSMANVAKETLAKTFTTPAKSSAPTTSGSTTRSDTVINTDSSVYSDSTTVNTEPSTVNADSTIATLTSTRKNSSSADPSAKKSAVSEPVDSIAGLANQGTSTQSSSESSGTWIIGAAAGVIIGVGLLIILTLVLVARKQRKVKKKRVEGSDETAKTLGHSSSSSRGRSLALEAGLWASKTARDVTIAPVVPSIAEQKSAKQEAKTVESQAPKEIGVETKLTAPKLAKTDEQLPLGNAKSIDDGVSSQLNKRAPTPPTMPKEPKSIIPRSATPSESTEPKTAKTTIREALNARSKALREMQLITARSVTSKEKSMGLKKTETMSKSVESAKQSAKRKPNMQSSPHEMTGSTGSTGSGSMSKSLGSPSKILL